MSNSSWKVAGLWNVCQRLLVSTSMYCENFFLAWGVAVARCPCFGVYLLARDHSRELLTLTSCYRTPLLLLQLVWKWCGLSFLMLRSSVATLFFRKSQSCVYATKDISAPGSHKWRTKCGPCFPISQAAIVSRASSLRAEPHQLFFSLTVISLLLIRIICDLP